MLKRPLAMGCLILVAVLVIITAIGGVPDNPYSKYEGQTVRLTGTVTDKKSENGKEIVYLEDVAFCDNTIEDSKKKLNIKCYMKTGTMPPLGSFVMLEGKIGEFAGARNPGQFDLREYNAQLGLTFPLYEADVVQQSREYNHWREGLWRIKMHYSKNIDSVFNQHDAAVMKAMLLGNKEDMTADIKSVYKAGGISHILAISGLHVSIIGIFLYSLLKLIGAPMIIRTSLPLFVMINYGIMTGAATSTVRAVFMFGYLMLSYEMRRTYDIITALALAALTISIGNRYILLNAGFWLSFLAVFGIAVFSRQIVFVMPGKHDFIRKRINTFLSSASVSLFTLPVLLYFYYEFPLYSVLVNLLVIPLMSVLMALGISAMLIADIWLFAANGLGTICHYILNIYDYLCTKTAKLPFADIVFGRPTKLGIAIFSLCILGIFGLTFLFERKRNAEPQAKMGRAGEETLRKLEIKLFGIKCILMILGVLLLSIGKNRNSITMLDVGQGDGICIIKNGSVYMLDGGSSSDSKLGEYTLMPFLKYSGICHIDYWFVSHTDMDHISGLMWLLENEDFCDIDMIVLPDTDRIREQAAELIGLASKKDIRIGYIGAGDAVLDDAVKITCLYPGKGAMSEDINELSEVLLLELADRDFRMLFTGDSTAKSESCYIAVAQSLGVNIADIDVLKAPHHGSNSSSSEDMVYLVNPRVVLISSGINNRYGHPNPTVVRRYRDNNASVYNTQDTGAITITFANNRYELDAFLE